MLTGEFVIWRRVSQTCQASSVRLLSAEPTPEFLRNTEATLTTGFVRGVSTYKFFLDQLDKLSPKQNDRIGIAVLVETDVRYASSASFPVVATENVRGIET